MKSFLFTLAFALLCVSSTSYAQDLKITNDQSVEVGRQYVIDIEAIIDGEKAALLIDVTGSLDYNTFEDETKFVYTPTSEGEIRLRVVAIWWKAQKVKQTVVNIKVGKTERPNPPPKDPEEPTDPVKPDPPQVDFSVLKKEVRANVESLVDAKGQAAVQRTYAELAEAVKSKSLYKLNYFGREFRYDFSVDEFMSTYVNDAVSKTIAKAKSEDSHTDLAPWDQRFFLPLKELSNGFDLDNREVLAGFLKAVSEAME